MTRRRGSPINPEEKAVGQNISLPFWLFRKVHDEAGSNGNISKLIVRLLMDHFSKEDLNAEIMEAGYKRASKIRTRVNSNNSTV